MFLIVRKVKYPYRVQLLQPPGTLKTEALFQCHGGRFSLRLTSIPPLQKKRSTSEIAEIISVCQIDLFF